LLGIGGAIEGRPIIVVALRKSPHMGANGEVISHGRRKKEVSFKLTLRQGCATPSAFNMAIVRFEKSARGGGGNYKRS
jgi:hypothetical protein